MTGIKQFICGESVRRSLEGATTEQIIHIANSPSPPPHSSPFAKVLGCHLAAEKPETKAKEGIRKKKKRRRG